jgi:cobyrinic acid a,c-diamide synthase
MSRSLRSLGYREATLLQDGPLGKRGDRLRGHEFHYSELIGMPDWAAAYQVSPRRSKGESYEGFQNAAGSILASYLHLHFASQPAAVEHFVSCLQRCHPSRPASAGTTQRRSGANN